MPPIAPPKNKRIRAAFDALRNDGKLTRQTKHIGLRLLKELRIGKWRPIAQQKFAPELRQPNVSRALRRLVDGKYVEKRRLQTDGRKYCYRLGKKWRGAGPLGVQAFELPDIGDFD